ncbi:MAG: hypothetical protein U0354_09370 [Candidatus Sericytochromatia bacterium]
MEQNNYYKSALKEVFNILLLVLIAVTGIIGLLKISLPLLVLEILYMLVIPNTPFYKSYIDFKNNSSDNNSIFKSNNKSYYHLPSPIKEKTQELQKKYNQIVKKVSKNQDFAFAIKDQIDNLNILIDKFVSFSENYISYKDYLKENDINTISKEIEETKKSIKNNFTDLKDKNDIDSIHNKMKNKNILQNNLEVLEKRLSKVKEISNLSENLKVQIDHIEDSFHLVSDYLMTTDSSNYELDVNKIIKEVELVESTIRTTQKEINKINNVKFDYN